ncbi:MAG: transporter [Chthoniobacter sp.]
MIPSSRGLRIVIGFALFAVAGAAHAGPPFLTDDPEPVDFQHWEIILATQQFHNVDGWSGTAPHMEINYGVVPDVQLHVLVANVYNKAPGEPARFGYGDTELGVKYRFVHETDYCPQIAFYPAVEIPTGNRNEDLGNGKAQVFLPVWLEKKFGDWTTYGGGGYWFNPGLGNRDNWFAGWEVQRKITSNLTLGAEVQLRTPESIENHTTVALNAGGSWDLSDTYHILFSAGHTVKGPSEFQGYLGLQITFGPKETGKDKK